MTMAAMQIEHCSWKGKKLVFKAPICFRLNINPFSGETIVEHDEMDIYVYADSYDKAANQVSYEIGYIWDTYIIGQNAADVPARAIALYLSALAASFVDGDQ